MRAARVTPSRREGTLVARLRREAPATARRLTEAQAQTIAELRREADLLGDAFIAAQCERALAGSGDAADVCLDFALELHGQLS